MLCMPRPGVEPGLARDANHDHCRSTKPNIIEAYGGRRLLRLGLLFPHLLQRLPNLSQTDFHVRPPARRCGQRINFRRRNLRPSAPGNVIERNCLSINKSAVCQPTGFARSMQRRKLGRRP
jgi:hypothetical protein